MIFSGVRLHGEFTELWTIGVDNFDMEEFAENNNGTLDPEPGSSNALDDHYYVSGTYPEPIGTVAANEDLIYFEPQIVSGDTLTRIYFPSPSESPSQVRYVLRFRTIWKGYWIPAENTSGETPGTHHFVVRCNGVDVSETLIAPYLETENDFTVSFTGQNLNPEGFNYIEIQHLGGTVPNGDPFPSSYWASLDFVSLFADPIGMLDNDLDGLPLYWESQYGLSDNNFADKDSDTDGDNLSAAAEFLVGTSPLNEDTDGDGLIDGDETSSDPLVSDTDDDGLKDGEEVHGTVPSNPQLADSDNDGASDSLEVALGTDPSDNGDTPAPFGQSIGINFVHNSESLGILQVDAATGVLSQTNWNQTRGLSWGELTGDENLIQQPTNGIIVDASGVDTGMTLNWSGNNPNPRSQLGEDTDLAAHRLYKGVLVAWSDGENSEEFTDLILNLVSVPFTTYDLILYLQMDNTNPVGRVTLNDDSLTTRNFASLEYEVLDGFKESVTYGEERISRGNYLRFRNVQGSNCKILIHSEAWNVGLAAIQILDMGTDTDSDTIPNAWERENKLDLESIADGGFDPDNDQLTNAEEFVQRTDPHLADTDKDGLVDGIETNTGVFVSESNTGTNPRNADTDQDGLSDYQEISSDGFRTDPNMFDSDSDGLDDGMEAEWRTDPNDNSIKILPGPNFSQSGNQLDWTIENLRLRLDYSKGRQLSQWGGGPALSFQILNGTEAQNENFTVNMRLEFNNGKLGYVLSLNDVGGFTHSTQGGGINLAHWSGNLGPLRPDDISTGIGLSGVGIIDYSDRIMLRFTATRTSPPANSWNIRFEIINQDTSETLVDLNHAGAIAASSIQDGTAFWNNDEGLPWPDLFVRQAALSISFSDGPLEDQSLYTNILDTDKDGLTDVYETQHGLAINDPSDALGDNDNDGLNNLTEQLIGTDPKDADSDDDNVSDFWEARYGSNINDNQSKPFSFEHPPMGDFEDFNNNGVSDVWERLATFLPANSDEDLDGFLNKTEFDWGTDPMDPTSTPEFFVIPGSSAIQLQWPQLIYKDFDFEHSSELKEWNPLTGSLAGHFRTSLFDISSGMDDKWFFRLNVKGDLPNGPNDQDGDGIGTLAEDLFNLSPINNQTSWGSTWIDTDGDGAGDSLESGDRYLLYSLMSDGLNPGTEISDLHASRFLTQSTFGPTTESINYLKQLGFDAWLDEQMGAIPPTYLTNVLLGFYEDLLGPRVRKDYYFFDDQNILPRDNMRTAWGKAALKGQDQLRQRVAFALSQIVVISGRDANLNNMPISVAGYYDFLIDHAFGNYYDILEYVTFNGCMGLYLSHAGNQKAQPELNIFPDENYAREIMQLFSIGLWELNPDGTRKLDVTGEPFPTYGQNEITELARVMTGFWFAGREFGQGGWTDRSGIKPMELHVSRHDFASKQIVGGQLIPAREPTLDNAYQDVKDAVRIIFENPNTAVFISKQLIQFLVTDNPSPEYVERVQNVFVDNGQGERGDLGAVVRAILMDAEARSALYFAHASQSGFLKEPAIRLMQLGRVFKVADTPNFQLWQLFTLEEEFNQDPLNAPSVFNFFKPHYVPSGLLGDENLVGPAFQILNSYSAISGPQEIWRFIQEGFSHPWREDIPQPFDYSEFIPFENDSDALVEKINILFCQGMMSEGTRAAIFEALTKLNALEDLPPGVNTQVAVWVAITSASGATQL